MFPMRRLRLDLRSRVVLFTSAAVVIALLLLGTTLSTLLARSLYTQQRETAVNVVQRARDQIQRQQYVEDASRDEALQRAFEEVTSGQAESSFQALLISRGRLYRTDGAPEADVLPPTLVEQVADGGKLAYVYVDSPDTQSDRVLVVGTPIEGIDATYQAYFVFPLTFQEQTLAQFTQILVAVGLLLLLVTIVLTVVLTGRVLQPIRRARDVAERIAEGDLNARIEHAAGSDDLSRLVESLNRMASTLEVKINELETLSTLQARFVSDVSHELRTPLATVRMAADYIHSARAGLPSDAQRAAVLLERELERFENLLEDLLEISRIDFNVVRLEPVEVDLGGLLDEVVEALDVVAHNRGVTLELEVDTSGGPPLVGGDPRRLERIFTNLVKNAVEHTTDGKVRVNIARDDTSVVVAVEDEGEGIPSDHLEHIFERFYRADVHRTRGEGGTGLGLAIALENVHLHDGSIHVHSQVGEGSTFTVRLPAAEPRGQEEAEQPSDAEGDVEVPVHG
jgi:two-component system sensor histidine kinase MtrB